MLLGFIKYPRFEINGSQLVHTQLWQTSKLAIKLVQVSSKINIVFYQMTIKDFELSVLLIQITSFHYMFFSACMKAAFSMTVVTLSK